MSDIAIRIQGLGKRYTIYGRRRGYRTLVETISDAIRFGFKPNPDSLLKPAQKEPFWAVKDVSFELKKGEVLGVVGRNGAGKSTLLKILSSITDPTEGYVDLYGRVGSLLEVGTGFHGELTGRENVYLNGAILGMNRQEISRKFDEIVAFAEIDKFVDTPVKRYSSGMYMRLAFAVAANLETEILIVDEVLAVGDTAFQRKCLGKMTEVSQEGRTVLFVSHNLSALSRLCTRGILLEGGKLVADGSTQEILKKYAERTLNSQAVYQVPEMRYPSPYGRLNTIIIEDAQGNPTPSISMGQTWQARILFTIHQPIDHFSLEFRIRTSEDFLLHTNVSSPRKIEPGQYQVIVRDPAVSLSSGRYTLGVGLLSNEQAFQAAYGIAFMEIADFSDGMNVVKVGRLGALINPMEFDIMPAAPVKMPGQEATVNGAKI